MPFEHRYFARINENWRITIQQAGSKWNAELHKRGESPDPLGTFDTFQEARAEVKARAQALIPTIQIGELTWKRFTSAGRRNGEALRTQLQHQLKAQEEHSRISNWTSMVLGLAAAIGGLLFTFTYRTTTNVADQTVALVSTLQTRTDSVQAQLKAILATSSQAPDQTKLAQKVDVLNASVNTLRSELENYKAAIGDDPAKRLAIPILRRDIDSLKEEQKTSAAQIHEDLNARTELMKWLLILFGAGNFFSGLYSNLQSSKKS
jgi:hypothetical protein